MSAREPQEMAQAAVTTGMKKAQRTWDRVLVSSFLAGAYIGFGALVAIAVSSGLDPKTWGTLPTLFTGAAFTLGLVLVVIAGSDLATGNMMLVPLSAMRGRIGVDASTPAGMMHERLSAIALDKATAHSAWQTFLRAVGCNWLVCLAVWMSLATSSVSGKILAIFFPIMAFVAMGFDHVVANMFFLPAAIFADVPGLGWGDVVRNWLLAGVGNLVGAVIFVSTSYWYLFLKGEPDPHPTADAEPAARRG